jgi:hypothetical protein
MTRQVALGAVVAFFATVIALSVWEPKAVMDPAVIDPAPAPAAPAAAPSVAVAKDPRAFKPVMLKPQGISRAIRVPVVVAQPLVTSAADAGTP